MDKIYLVYFLQDLFGCVISIFFLQFNDQVNFFFEFIDDKLSIKKCQGKEIQGEQY